MRSLRRNGALAALVVLVAGCERAPHVVLTVTDPGDLAAGAERLAVGSQLDTLVSKNLRGRNFPVTVTLTGAPRGTSLLVWADALDGGGGVLARGRVRVEFPNGGRTGTAELALAANCSNTGAVGNLCELEDREELGVCDAAGRCGESICGDGAVDPTRGETCDDGNADVNDVCPDGPGGTCQDAACGDGFVNVATEECDDGNLVNEDACTASCTVNECGDGFLLPGVEACDDGNTVDEDNCRVTCEVNVCGDGVINSAPRSPTDPRPVEDCEEVSGCEGLVDCDPGTSASYLNPNDACHRCRLPNWQATTRLGLGDNVGLPSLLGGDPATLSLQTVAGIATTGEGDILVSDRNSNRVWRYDVSLDVVYPEAGIGVASPVDTNDGAPTDVGDGRIATLAAVAGPTGMAVDGNGDVYIADASLHRVRRINRVSGTISTYAGTGSQGFDVADEDVNATLADLDEPRDVAVDAAGNVFIVDRGNRRVRRVDAVTGRITTVAGSSASCALISDGASATAIGLCDPIGCELDSAGRLYVVDRDMKIVLRVLPDATVERVAGNGNTSSMGDDGPARDAEFLEPFAITFGADGSLYVADASGDRVRRVVPDGGEITLNSTIEAFAGTGLRGSTGDGGDALIARLEVPVALATVGPEILIGGLSGRVRRVDAVGTIDSVLGVEDINSLSGTPADDFRAIEVAGIEFDDNDNLYVVDQSAHRILRRNPDGTVDVVAGGGPLRGNGDIAGDGGPAIQARLNQPMDLAIADDGDIYIADAGNHRIRRIDAASGIISTYAGFGLPEDSLNVVRVEAGPNELPCPIGGDCTPDFGGFSGDGDQANVAELGFPSSIEVDDAENVYFYDYLAKRLRWIDASTGVIDTLAGLGGLEVVSNDAPAATQEVGVIADMAYVPSMSGPGMGTLYLASYNTRSGGTVGATIVWEIDLGSAMNDMSVLSEPMLPDGSYFSDIGVDSTGLIYLAAGDLDLELVGPDEVIYTMAPTAPTPIPLAGMNPIGIRLGDGSPAEFARFRRGPEVALDSSDVLFTAEGGITDRVRTIDPVTSVITPILGWLGPGDGPFLRATLGSPQELLFVDFQSTGPALRSWFALDAAGVPAAAPDSGTIRRIDFDAETLDTYAGSLLGNEQTGGFPSGPSLYARGFTGASGIAFDPGDGGSVGPRIYVSEASTGLLSLVHLDPTDPENSTKWVSDRYSGVNSVDPGGYVNGPVATAEYREPKGLAFDEMSRTLYVADSGNHVIRAIDVDAGLVTAEFGTAGSSGFSGDGGPAAAAQFTFPSAIWLGGDGSFYVADTGNHRVRYISPGGTISTVLGTGEPSNAGLSGRGDSLPVSFPTSLDVDGSGNLFVTAGEVVRVLSAGDDGLALGDDLAATVYGVPPRTVFPEAVTRCARGIKVDPTQGDGSRVYFVDGCLGLLVELQRESPTDVPLPAGLTIP